MKIHRKWIYVSYLLIRLHTPQPPSSTWYLVHSTCWLSSKPDSPFFLFPHLLLVLSYGNVWSFFNNQIYFLGFQVSWTNRNNVFQHRRRSEQLQIQQRPGRVFGKHNPTPISRASKCRCPTPDNQDQSSLSRHPSFLATPSFRHPSRSKLLKHTLLLLIIGPMNSLSFIWKRKRSAVQEAS